MNVYKSYIIVKIQIFIVNANIYWQPLAWAIHFHFDYDLLHILAIITICFIMKIINIYNLKKKINIIYKNHNPLHLT